MSSLCVDHITSAYLSLIVSSQLIPLCCPPNPDRAIHYQPRLYVTGFIDDIDRHNYSIVLNVFQWIEGASIRDNLTVVGLLKPCTRWPIPNSRMPKGKGLVSLCGAIDHMQHTTITVIIQSISFLDQKSRPTAASLKRNSTILATTSYRRPSCSALQKAKRARQNAPQDDYLEDVFSKEKAWLASD